MALHESVTWGNHFVFTYGPLGFLSVPTLWYTDTGTIAVLYALLLRLALALALFAGARRTYGGLGGAIVALVVAGASVGALEPVPFLVFGVWMIDRGPPAHSRLVLLAVAGCVAGLELLNKESIGIELAVMAIIISLASQGRRRDNVTVTLAALILGLLSGWALTGQDWEALPAYARNSVQIISGYAAALGLRPIKFVQYLEFPAAALAFAFGLAGALNMTAGQPTRKRAGIVALWVAFCFFEFKEGFVRLETGHVELYFAAVMGGFLAFTWRMERRVVGLGMVALLFAFAVSSQSHSRGTPGHPAGLARPFSAAFAYGRNVRSAFSELRTLSSSSSRAATLRHGRQAIERTYPIDPISLSLLRGHTVHVDPSEAGVAWAYKLDWRPLPVIQSLSAYTHGLDQDDTEMLNAADAPQRILRLPEPEPRVAGRVVAFDEGATTRTMLCHYRELRTTATLQVLGRGVNRCRTPFSLGTVHAGWNQAVSVPAPPNDRSFVFVRIGGVAVGGHERVLALLYEPAERAVFLDGVRHKLVEGTAMDGLILRAPETVDFTAPFNVAPDSATIAVGESGHTESAGKPITFAFFAQTVSASPRWGVGTDAPRPAHANGSKRASAGHMRVHARAND